MRVQIGVLGADGEGARWGAKKGRGIAGGGKDWEEPGVGKG